MSTAAVELDPLAPLAPSSPPPRTTSNSSTLSNTSQLHQDSIPTAEPSHPAMQANSPTAESDSTPTSAPISPIKVVQELPADLPVASEGVLPVVEMESLTSAAEEEEGTRLTAAEKGKGRSIPAEELANAEESRTEGNDLEDLTNVTQGITISEHTPPITSPSPRSPSPPATQPEVEKAHTAPVDKEEREEEWLLKTISWPPLPPPPSVVDHTGPAGIEEGPTIKIISQNVNGPCSLIALCNILILRGDIHVTPPSRKSVSYSYLSSLVADHLVTALTSTNSPSLDLASVLSILPSTRYGLDLNPRFGSIDGFRALNNQSGELALFNLSKIPLLHGWVVDPQDEKTWDVMVEKTGDYDTAVESIVVGEVISGGLGEEDGVAGGEEEILRKVEARSKWTKEEERKVEEAYIIKDFLSSSRTQLTYHGLFLLSSHLAPSSLSALFRNSHLSVLYRRPILPSPLPPSSPDFAQPPVAADPGPQLFTLVTDSSFVNEPGVVWESLEDVDGSASEFYDGALRRSTVRGGDWVGRQRRPSRPVEGDYEEIPRGQQQGYAPPADDHALAQQLQHEEEVYAHRESERDRRHHRAQQEEEERRRKAATRAPGVLQPGALSAGPESVAGTGSGRGKIRSKKDTKDNKDKDKCLVM